MKVSNAVTFLVVRSFLVSAKLNSLSLKKHPSQGVIDTKLFARVRDVTGKQAKAKRVLQFLGGAFGSVNETTALAGLSDGLAILLNDTGVGGGAGGLINGTQAFIGGLTNNGTGDLPNELLEVNGTGIFNQFFGFPNGTDLFAGMFNGTETGFFGFPNGTDLFGAMFNDSSGFFGLPNGTDLFGWTFNGSSGFFGLPNETIILDGIFNGTGSITDIIPGLFNVTGNVTSEMFESWFGENLTDITSGLWNGTSENGEDIFAGIPEGLGDFFAGFNGTDTMVCPETCAAEVCNIFSSDDGPDIEVLGDACEAGIIKECAGMYASLCELLCSGDVSDGANSAFFDFNASEVGDICSMCSFLDCCDGNNSFEKCVALLPAEAFPDGVVSTGGTGSASNESPTSEEAVDEDTVAADATDNVAADEDSINDASTSLEDTAETTADASSEPEDGSQAPMLSISRCVSSIFLVVLLLEF